MRTYIPRLLVILSSATPSLATSQVAVLPPPISSAHLPLAALDTVAATRSVEAARADNRANAMKFGIKLADALQDVSIPPDPPNQTQIEKEAADSRRALEDLFRRKAKVQRYLGLSVGVGDALTKIGQFAGGGGAVIFGLQAANTNSSESGAKNNGRNAAYSGAVAAGVTLLGQLFDLDNKKKAAAACKSLDGERFSLEAQTRAWELQAPDPNYRAGFMTGDFKRFNDAVSALSKSCFT